MGKRVAKPPGGAPPVVVYAPRGRDQRLVVSLLDRQGLGAIACESFEALIEQAQAGRGPIVVAEEALAGDGLGRLCRVLDDQPPWSELPVLVMRLKHGRVDAPMQSLLKRAGVRWLTRPIPTQWLSGLVTTAIEARRRQVQVGELLREQEQLNRQLQHRGDLLRELTVELVEAEDRERRRISAMLHDDLQQMLVGASFRLEAVIKKVDDTSVLMAPLDQVRRLIADAQQRCRRLSHELFPSALRDGDLPAVLHWLADQAQADYALSVDLDCDQDLGEVSPTILRFVFRAVREILLNVVKHADTDAVRVVAERRGDALGLTLIDRGIGFDPDQLGEDTGVTGGIGLIAIRERLYALGGEWSIDSKPGQGSRFSFSIPANA